MYPYQLRTCLESIFIVGISWKITQVTRMPAWPILVQSEEDDLLGTRPSALSWRDLLFWGLPNHLLFLGRIPINKWGLRPNIRVQAFAPTITIYLIILLIFFFNLAYIYMEIGLSYTWGNLKQCYFTHYFFNWIWNLTNQPLDYFFFL